MLNVHKFDDINYLELHNEELEEILNKYYNIYLSSAKDKYGLSKDIYAIVQFEDNSVGAIDNDTSDKYYPIYELHLDTIFIEGNGKVLTDINFLLRNKYVDQQAVVKYNLQCKDRSKKIKRIFVPDGYSEF